MAATTAALILSLVCFLAILCQTQGSITIHAGSPWTKVSSTLQAMRDETMTNWIQDGKIHDLYKNVIEISKLLMTLEVATSRLEKNQLDLDSRLGEVERVLAEKYGHRQDKPHNLKSHTGVSEEPTLHQPGATPTSSHQQDDSNQKDQVGTGDEKEPNLTGSYDHQKGHEGEVKTEEMPMVTGATGEGDMNTKPDGLDHGRVTLPDLGVDQQTPAAQGGQDTSVIDNQQQQMGVGNELNELDEIIDMASRLESHHDTKPLAELRSNARSPITWGEARRRTNISPEIQALDRMGRLIERGGMPWMPKL